MLLGAKHGKKAFLVGGITAILPDLDVLVTPMFNTIDQLSIHRGITHSLLFLFAIPLLYMGSKKLLNRKISYDWPLLIFIALLSHLVLDVMTNYGTQIFQPFSNRQVSLSNISVIDPVFTLPVLVFLLISMVSKKPAPVRTAYNKTGLLIGGVYLLLTLVNKSCIENHFKNSLQKQAINYEKLSVIPSSLGNLLWHAVAKTEDGWYVGDYSLMDQYQDINFTFYEGNKEILKQYDSRVIQKLIWYTNGNYLVRQEGGFTRMYHLKCHLTQGYENNPYPSAGFFEITKSPDGNTIISSKMMQSNTPPGELIANKWRRIMGHRTTPRLSRYHSGSKTRVNSAEPQGKKSNSLLAPYIRRQEVSSFETRKSQLPITI